MFYPFFVLAFFGIFFLVVFVLGVFGQSWAKAGPKPGPSRAHGVGIFETPFFCGNLKPWTWTRGGHFQNPFLLREFETLDPDMFPKSQIFKISCSSHSKNAHIKLNGFQWVFCGWGDAPFIFFMGRMGQKSKNGPSRAPHPPVRAVYPPGVGLLIFCTRKNLVMQYESKPSLLSVPELEKLAGWHSLPARR